ncbi:hypothetical protein [Botrimarina sp.]|uniref:hypothetical protein n=1 Tax=Botrimarina sp. TaxID=2795802 RepID=UPI0032EBEB61
MTRPEAELVRDSWRRAEPIADTVTRLFYLRLFELTPEVRGRLGCSLCEQCDRLAEAVDQLVESYRFGAGAGVPVAEPAAAAGESAAVVDAWLWAITNQLGGADSDRVGRAWSEAIRGEAGRPFRSVALGGAAPALV